MKGASLILMRPDDLSRRPATTELPRGEITVDWLRERCFDDTMSRRGKSHDFVFRSKSLSKFDRRQRNSVERQLVHCVSLTKT